MWTMASFLLSLLISKFSGCGICEETRKSNVVQFCEILSLIIALLYFSKGLIIWIPGMVHLKGWGIILDQF